MPRPDVVGAATPCYLDRVYFTFERRLLPIMAARWVFSGGTALALALGLVGWPEAADAQSRRVNRFVFDTTWLADVPPPGRPLLMFDGGCPFCRAAARLVARLERNQRLALLSRDDEATTSYVARIPAHEIQVSWHLVEPTGVRMMHGPAGIRVLEYIPATRWLAWIMRTFRLTPLVTALNQVLGRTRKPLDRFSPIRSCLGAGHGQRVTLTTFGR